MMHASRRALTAASLVLLTGVALSCSSGADNVMGNNGALVLEPGLNLLADPMVIILDPNDANAPRDPTTQELIGSTALSAIVLGSDLSPTVDDTVTFTATDGILASGGQQIATDSAGLAPDTLSVTESGPSLITVTATTATETKSLDIIVDIAPTAVAGDDQTVECPTPVTLDGSGSTDPNSTAGTNDDIVAFEWFEGQTKIADGEVVQVDLAVGTHTITLQVTDKAGATATDDVIVTVIDTTAPVVTLHMSPDHLWPPNHKWKTVDAILDIQDCDPSPTVELVSVTSNEPENGLGDGDTAPDISGANLGTDDRSVKVRAERSGTGTGRVYTFTYRVTDASGNFTDATATVTVPHDQGH